MVLSYVVGENEQEEAAGDWNAQDEIQSPKGLWT